MTSDENLVDSDHFLSILSLEDDTEHNTIVSSTGETLNLPQFSITDSLDNPFTIDDALIGSDRKYSTLDADDQVFRIQDFSTPSPLERMARQIAQILLRWKDDGALNQDCPVLKEEIITSSSSGTQYSLHYHSEPVESNTDCLTPYASINGHSMRFFGGRVAQLYRWFGTAEYIAISIGPGEQEISSAQSNGLLSSLLIACDETSINLPCFVLMSKLKRARFIGQLTRPPLSNQMFTVMRGHMDSSRSGVNEFFIVEYETDSESNIPEEIEKSGSHNNPVTFLDHFFLKIGVPKVAVRLFGDLIIGSRLVYCTDEFPPLTWTFWNSNSMRNSQSSGRGSTISIPDPITQIHLCCTQPLKSVSPDDFNLVSKSLNPSETIWTLRVVSVEEFDYPRYLKDAGVVSGYHRLLLSHTINLLTELEKNSDASSIGKDENSEIWNASTKDNSSASIQTASAVTDERYLEGSQSPSLQRFGLLEALGRKVDQALEAALLPTSLELEASLSYLFELNSMDDHESHGTFSDFACHSNDSSNDGNGIDEIDTEATDDIDTVSRFEFRLIEVICRLKSYKGIQLIWNEIVERLRFFWDKLELIPNLCTTFPPILSFGCPKVTDPPILQKLKSIQCCVYQNLILNNLKSPHFNKNNILPVFSAFDFVTYQLSSISTPNRQSNSDVYLPLTSLMQIYQRKIATSTTKSVSHFKDWLSQVNNSELIIWSLKDLLKPFTVPIGTPISVEQTSEQIWDECWEAALTSSPNQWKIEELFSPSLQAEINLHWLENLTPYEVALESYHLFLHLFMKQFRNIHSSCLPQSTIIDQAMENMIHSIDKNYPRIASRWSGSRDAMMEWSLVKTLKSICPLAQKSTSDEKAIQDIENDCSQAAMGLQSSIERMEVTLTIVASMTEKFRNDIPFAVQLLHAINTDGECEIENDCQKNSVLQLMSPEHSSISTLEPFNTEHIFAYVPHSIDQMPCELSPGSSLLCFHRMYVSVLPHEFRIALATQSKI